MTRRLADDLLQGLKGAVAHAEGRARGGASAQLQVHRIEVPDVKALRRRLKMSQRDFAEAYAIPLSTLKNWEQGRRVPDGPAAAYLRVIARRPKETMAALI